MPAVNLMCKSRSCLDAKTGRAVLLIDTSSPTSMLNCCKFGKCDTIRQSWLKLQAVLVCSKNKDVRLLYKKRPFTFRHNPPLGFKELLGPSRYWGSSSDPPGPIND